jgi:hypothetical protein
MANSAACTEDKDRHLVRAPRLAAVAGSRDASTPNTKFGFAVVLYGGVSLATEFGGLEQVKR